MPWILERECTSVRRANRTDRYIYLSEFAAANLYMRQQRPEAACAHYRRVADAMPDREEGKAARRALRKLQDAKSCAK